MQPPRLWNQRHVRSPVVSLHPNARHIGNHFAVAVLANPTARPVAKRFRTGHRTGHPGRVEDALPAHPAVPHRCFHDMLNRSNHRNRSFPRKLHEAPEGTASSFTLPASAPPTCKPQLTSTVTCPQPIPASARTARRSRLARMPTPSLKPSPERQCLYRTTPHQAHDGPETRPSDPAQWHGQRHARQQRRVPPRSATESFPR